MCLLAPALALELEALEPGVLVLGAAAAGVPEVRVVGAPEAADRAVLEAAQVVAEEAPVQVEAQAQEPLRCQR